MDNPYHSAGRTKCFKRRIFLKALLSTLALGGCSNHHRSYLPTISDSQSRRRKQGRSTVAIIRCPSYECDLFKAIKAELGQMKLPDLKGKKVVIKPNMVEFQPEKPVCTNPTAIKAAVELADYLGAREIVIGEGPGHMRDTEFLLSQTGIGKICSKLGLQFIDLNLDNLERIDHKDGFSGIDAWYLPKTIANADAVITLPKLKTHHWVGMTASMKNLFGAVPGRKYGWPKNILHVRGIPHCIIDLVHLIKPSFALVDAVIAMEGDGPINGTSKNTGFLVLGTDLAAVDATCARAMGIVPTDLYYLTLAGEVVGNIGQDNIDVVGASIESVKQSFARPITLRNKDLATQQSS